MIDTVAVALKHVRIIDLTGAPAREDQTVNMRDLRIAALGSSALIVVPPDARVLDLAGESVISGLVLMYEHLYHPTAPDHYANLAEGFTRLYLTGGVTSMRTAGNVSGMVRSTSRARSRAARSQARGSTPPHPISWGPARTSGRCTN